MPILPQILLVSWVAGLTMFLGGWLSRSEKIPEGELKVEMLHGIVALGGGILVAAVALVLVPTGLAALSVLPAGACFLTGAAVFMLFDKFLSTRRGSMAQFMAMLMDFIPEALSLGAVFASNHKLGILLALYIGAQNFPEGFNAYREVVQTRRSSRKVLRVMLLLSLLGPMAAFIGYKYLQSCTNFIAGLMLFAAGGILYLIFQDIAPQVKMKRHWAPPFGATIGFLIGMIGNKLLG